MQKQIDLSKCMTLKNHAKATEIRLGFMEKDEDENREYFIDEQCFTNGLRELHNTILMGSEKLSHVLIKLADGKRHFCTVGDYLRFYDTYTRIEM